MKNNKQSLKIPKKKEMKSLISPKRESICSLKIDLEKGKSENLNIYQNSNPDELAYNFCLKHSLDFKSVKNLIAKIKYCKENKDILEKDKENMNFSFNLINIKESSKSLTNSFLNNKINNKRKIINNNIYNLTNNEIENKKKNNEFYTAKNIYINSNNMTPINFRSNFSKNNIDYTSDKNLNAFNFFSPNTNNNNEELMNNYSNINKYNNDDINIKSEIVKKDSHDNTNNSIWTSNFNDSINDKINNLEKAYANFNPENKKIKNESIKNTDNNIEGNENMKEIISEAIQNCMSLIEKEEPTDNINLTVSESNNNSNEMRDLELKNKTISKDINNTENIPINNSIFSDKNDKDNFNLVLLTPKKRKDSNKSDKKVIEDNNISIHQISNSNIDKDNSMINIPKKTLLFNSCSNNELNKENQNSLNNKFFENEDKIRQDNDVHLNNFEDNNASNEMIIIPQANENILNINNSLNNNLDFYNNGNSNNLDFINKNNNDNNKNTEFFNNNLNNIYYNLDYNDTKLDNSNNFNIKTLNNNIIQKEINFSLISNKNNYTISYSHKDYINKRSYKRVLQKNYRYNRSYNDNEKKLDLFENNSIKGINNISNNNSFCYNNINKDSISSQKNTNNLKRIKNFSSIKAINNDNDKHIYSPLKINKSLNKCCLLSYTRSEKNMMNMMNKNSKNKDNNRTTITSTGNYTNNNSNFITRGSTSIKIYSHKNLINYNLFNKIPLNQTFNFSNEFILRRQQQKESNSYCNHHNNTIINNSHHLYYTNSISNNNNKSIKNNHNNTVNKKNKRLIFSHNLNLQNSLNSNNSNNKDNSLEYLKTKINNKICDENKNTSNIKINMEKRYYHLRLNKNNITRKLQAKNDVMNSLKIIFNYIAKNNMILDVFTVVNKKNIPEEIYGIVKKIVRNCNKKKRFIEYNEFINQAFYLFDRLSNEEKITILNFNKINLRKSNLC